MAASGNAHRLAGRNRTIAPDEDWIARGAKFGCRIDRGAEGELVPYTTSTATSACVTVFENTWAEVGGIRSTRRISSSPIPKRKKGIVLRRRFLSVAIHYLAAQGVRGTVCMASVLRIKYAIDETGNGVMDVQDAAVQGLVSGGIDESSEFLCKRADKNGMGPPLKARNRRSTFGGGVELHSCQRFNYS